MLCASAVYAGLPSVAEYFELLPLGLDSHPDCVVKASVYRNALESRPLNEVVTELPDALVQLVREPPPVSVWVPEAHANAIMIAIRDRHFEAGPAGLDAFQEWAHERNQRLLTRPLYRALFLLLSPERLLSGLERRWSAFRRGTSLHVLEAGRGHAAVSLRYPTNLYDEVALAGLTGAFRAAAEAAGAHAIKVELAERTPRQARWVAGWR